MRAIDTILCPVDFSEPSEHALRSAQALARQLEAALTAVHVLDEPAYAVFHDEGEQLSELVAEYQTAMKKQLSELVAALDPAIATRVPVARGSAADTIARIAEQDGFDLVVMGTHGRTGLRHMLVGSVTERVLRLSRVPVLTTRVPEPATERAAGSQVTNTMEME